MLEKKRGMEMAISTLIAIVLGIALLALIIVMLTSNWQKFQDTIKNYIGTDEQSIRDACEVQCSMGKEHDFCCEKKNLRPRREVKCPELNISCSEITCGGICIG